MMDYGGGWLSKSHPPKELLKRSVTVRQKGPLSRSTPPRRMVVNKVTKNQICITQNSPPPPQLLTATKQSTLVSYFGIKGDNFKSGAKETRLQRKERSPLKTPSFVQEHLCKQPFHMTLVENEGIHVCNERSFEHSLHQSYISKPSLIPENSKDVKDSTVYTNNPILHRESKKIVNNVHSIMPISGSCCRVIGCSCNKENAWQDCNIQCSTNLEQDLRSTHSRCYQEGISQEDNNSEMFHDECGSSTISKTDQFVTFSEGLELLSCEDTAVYDNSESFTTLKGHSLVTEHEALCNEHKWQDHSPVTEHEVSCSEHTLSYSCEKHLDKHRHDLLVINSSSRHGHNLVVTDSSNKHRHDFVVTDRSNKQEHDFVVTDRSNKQGHDFVVPDSSNKQGHDFVVTDISSKHEKLSFSNLQLEEAGRVNLANSNCNSYTSRADLGDTKAGSLDILTQQELKKQFCSLSQPRSRNQKVKQLQDSNRDVTIFSSPSNGVMDSSRVPDNKRHLNNGHFLDMNTPIFTEDLLTAACVGNSNDTDKDGSVHSEWCVQRMDQFQSKKTKYMSDIGTITFSEDM